jgi:hypothetical protein
MLGAVNFTLSKSNRTMRKTKKFYQMMSEITSFLESELEMNRKSKSFIDSCNLLLFRYQCACRLRKKYDSALCLVVLNALYNIENILSETRVLLALIDLSGEKSQWKFEKELSDIGLKFIGNF